MWLSVNGLVILQRTVWAGEGEGVEPPWSLKAESTEEREAGYCGPILGFSSPGFCALPSSLVGAELLPFAQVFASIYSEGVVSVGCGQSSSSRGHRLLRGRAAW